MAEISKVRFGGIDYDIKSITDTTFSEKGTPADAKATGDKISGLSDVFLIQAASSVSRQFPYTFHAGNRYTITNNTDTGISFQTRLTKEGEAVEAPFGNTLIGAGEAKSFICTIDAFWFSSWSPDPGSISVFETNKQIYTLESITENNTDTINIADLFYNENYESSLWRKGWWGATTGYYDSAPDNAICLSSYIADNIVDVQCDSNYKFRLQAWDSSNDYQGIWNGTAFAKANPNFYLTSIDVNKFRQIYPDFSYKIVLYASDGTSDVSLSEAANVSYRIPNTRRLKESLEELDNALTETVKVLPSVTPSATAFDLNTETESGNRLLRGGSEGYINAPAGFVSGGLVTFAMKNDYILQLLRDNLGNLFYRNRGVSGEWSDWAMVSVSANWNDMYNFANVFRLVSTGYRKAGQAFCLVGDNLVSCDGNGGMYVYNISEATYNALTGGNVGHGNSITYDPANNEYYVSGWDDGNVYVVSIDFDSLTYTINKTIDVSACGLRTTAGYVQLTQQLFVVACQSTTTIGTSYKLCLTDLDGNIQKEVYLPYSFNAVQDIHVYGLNAYVSHGMNSTYPSFIYVFNTQTLELIDVFEFSEKFKTAEIEGITKYENDLLLAFGTGTWRVKF